MVKPSLQIVIFLVLTLLFSGCVSVKSYQKMYLNDSEMILAPKKIQQFEINFETYREAKSSNWRRDCKEKSGEMRAEKLVALLTSAL